jgi:CHAT domain-containing protein
VRFRRGSEAGTAQLLSDLPQARWVHLATHGFFADARMRSILQMDERLFEQRSRGERGAPGARNPLVLSGLVLAGANLPAPTDAEALLHSDGGILTAEAIAGLPLDGLELAVLSACETGLGEVAGGEGVFGLQRAFHLAGARTVVASLWKVDDRATQILMAEFYRNLWEKKRSKLEALRQAQLTLLHRFDRQTGKLRGLDEIEVSPKPANPKETSAGAPPLYWAAFVLSGDWR